MVSRSELAKTALIPEEFAQRYRQEGLWLDQTIPEFLLEACRRRPQDLALVASYHGSAGPEPVQVRWSYRELEEAGWAAAERLGQEGVKPGDRVLLQLANTADYLQYLLGIFWAGALPVFCLPAHRQEELAHFAQVSDAAAHVFSSQTIGADLGQVHQKLVELLEQRQLEPPLGIDVAQGGPSAGQPTLGQPAELSPIFNTVKERKSEQIAFLQLSGGTTGLAKLIPRTHADYLYSVRASAQICGLTKESTTLVVLPAAHNFTMSSAGILGAIHVGAPLVFAQDPSPQTSFRLIAREKVKVVALVPPLAQAWLESAQRRRPQLDSLELLQVGGAKLLTSVAKKIEPVLGCKLQQVFGMAEGLVNYTRSDDPDAVRFQTQGRPISSLDEILVLDDAGQPVEPGQSGHLLTRGPYTIRGYYGQPQENLTSFTPEGFYRSGDIVRLDPAGNIEVTGRAKDQINRNGEKIAVDEIEDLALAHRDVFDAVVVGLPDPQVGERVCLVVLPGPGADFGQNPRSYFYDYFSAAGLAAFKIPERVEIMARFPVTKVGKVSRQDIRLALLKELGGTSS